MNNRKKILVLGSTGLVGSAVMRSGLSVTHELTGVSSKDANLCESFITRRLFDRVVPDIVVVAAAKVGGISANDNFGGDFIRENLSIELNVIEAARQHAVSKLVFLGSSCIYPRDCPQPIREDYFMSGKLEQTNSPYAIAKIAGIEMCDAYRRQYGCDFVSLMPTNLYGPGDNYNLDSSHVLPAMLRKFHEAKITGAPSVSMWGTGEPYREFLHVDDLASAIGHVITNNLSWSGPMNVGTGLDVRIKDLASAIADITGYSGEILWDSSRPDGTPRKLLNVNMIHNIGWSHKIHLVDGIAELYDGLKNKPVGQWGRT